MRAQFITTKEFNENINSIKQILTINSIEDLLGLIVLPLFFILLYFGGIILVDSGLI